MSHFTHLQTRFQNLFYLKKALNKLNIIHREKEETITESNLSNVNIVIPQSNNYDVEFVYNDQEYELVVDLSFWEQPYPVESFIDRIAQQYAKEVIVGESQKIGFQPMKSESNIDGSITLRLERCTK